MAIVQLSDKSTILKFLRKDPFLHLYAIGDLDDFFWPYTRWYGLERGDGELRSVLLIYEPGELSVVLALEESDHEAAATLIGELMPTFPERFYCHISPMLTKILQPHFKLEPHGRHHKMRLAALRQAPGRRPEFPCRTLTDDDIEAMTRLYAESYPGNWFDALMVETGKFKGLSVDGRLTAVAGIHVYSSQFGVAALGNIATHPEWRRRGLGESVTHELCRDLLASAPAIGLNVAADNAAAIRCYEKLGFVPHALYDEYMAHRVSATPPRL